MTKKYSETTKTPSFATAQGQQCVPGQERRLNLFTAPTNRFERRSKLKAMRKLTRRSTEGMVFKETL